MSDGGFGLAGGDGAPTQPPPRGVGEAVAEPPAATRPAARRSARRRTALIVAGIALGAAAVLAAGHTLRQRLGIELTPEGLQDWVASRGWAAPAIFLAIVSFRPFLLLPSALLLSVGGLCFGTGLGTALGAAGLLASGMMQYGIARGAGHDFVQARLGGRLRVLRQRLERAGPIAVGIATAHPAGPLTWVAWAAGLSPIPLLGFAAALALGGTVRSFTFAVFGAALTDVTSPRFVVATALVFAAGVLPLLHPKVFRWMIGGAGVERAAKP